MAAGGCLHLLVPGLLGPVPAQLRDLVGDRGVVPVTERLLSRASRLRARAPAGVEPWPAAFPGAGASGVLGAGGDPGDAFWYCADPVHLRPDRDRLMLFGGEPVRLGDRECEQIVEAFNDLFGEDGFTLVAFGSALFLRVERPPAGSAPSPHATREVSGRYLDAFLPEGEEGREWRQFLNETQMLLHGLPFNADRETNGQLSVNGLWFWGGGRLPGTDGAGDLDACLTDDPVLAGLTRQRGARVEAAVERLSQVPASPGEIAVHWPAADDALTGGDVEGWLAALQRFEQAWANEAESALTGGTWAEIRVYAGGDRGFRWTRGARRRFWRRPRAFAHWLERA